jgi:putative ABC transport system permease protein
MSAVDPGFRTKGILGFSLSVPSDHKRALNDALYERILSGITGLPGVRSVGLITYLPPELRKGVFIPFSIPGRPPSQPDERLFCNFQMASEGYFDTLGIPLLDGRAFSDADTTDSAPVAIVNEALARRYFPQGALGLKIATAFDRRPHEIVGVTRTIRDRGLTVAEYPTVYVPFRQFSFGYGSIAVRADAPTAALAAGIRARVKEIDPTLPLTDFQTLDDRVRDSLGEPRFYTAIAGLCAAMAILFVTLGLYGVVAYSVSRQTAEIGVRLAMGAQRSTIVRMVVGQGLMMGAAGAVVGAALAFWLTRLLTRWLFTITPGDPATFIAATAFVLCVTLAASYIPARRASGIDPLTALRQE